MKKPCVGLKFWVKFMKWVGFVKCFEFWVKNLNFCFKIWVKISVIFRQKPEFVILSVSEVSKNGKFSFNLCGFFCCGLRLATRWVAFLQRLKMTKRAQKPKNKAFKKFSVPKSASNERERERESEREGPRPNTAPFSLYLKALR